jgi:hypothetical protein
MSPGSDTDLCLRQCTNKLRRRQIVTETANQASVASNKTSEDERPGKSCHTIAAKAIMPGLPIAAPSSKVGACRENSREGEEESADSRAIFFRDHASKNANASAKIKSGGRIDTTSLRAKPKN